MPDYYNREPLGPVVLEQYAKDLGFDIESIQGKRILDAGAGGGWFQQDVETLGIAQVTSLDNGSWELWHGMETVPIIRENFLTGTSLLAGSYNCIFARATMESMIHHLGDLDRALLEADRLLVPDGGELRFGPGALEITQLNHMSNEDIARLTLYRERIGNKDTLPAEDEHIYKRLEQQAAIAEMVQSAYPWTFEQESEFRMQYPREYAQATKEITETVIGLLAPGYQATVVMASNELPSDASDYVRYVRNRYVVVRKDAQAHAATTHLIDQPDRLSADDSSSVS